MLAGSAPASCTSKHTRSGRAAPHSRGRSRALAPRAREIGWSRDLREFCNLKLGDHKMKKKWLEAFEVGVPPLRAMLTFEKNKLFFRKLNMAATGHTPTGRVSSRNFLTLRSPSLRLQKNARLRFSTTARPASLPGRQSGRSVVGSLQNRGFLPLDQLPTSGSQAPNVAARWSEA